MHRSGRETGPNIPEIGHMNATAIVRGFGFQGLSDFITIERVRDSVRRIGLTGHASTGSLLPPSIHFYGGEEPRRLGMAESVKKLALNASNSLSPQLHQGIKELANLKEDWDGEGAKPVKAHVLADAVDTLKQLSLLARVFHEPFVAPTFDGFVQLEWHGETRSLDIEAVDKGWSAVGTLIGADGNRHYYTAEFERNNFSQVARFYQWVVGDELIWPSL